MFPSFSLVVALAAAPASPCAEPLDRSGVSRCAKASSARIVADRERVAAARGEAEAARVLLPDNPSIALSAAERRNSSGRRALNIAGSLSVPIALGGQRRARHEVSSATIEARSHGVEITTRDVIANALLAYYDVLGTQAELDVLERGASVAARLEDVAIARERLELASGLEVELARAESSALAEQVALARGQLRVHQAELARALGLDPAAPAPAITGDLDPLPVRTSLDAALNGALARPELQQSEATVRALRAKTRLLRRERIPSPSFSLFAQTDGFDERVIGAGISIPIPLPFPLGHTNRGEIQATRAQAKEAGARLEARSRDLQLSATTAFAEYTARRRGAAVYSEARTRSAAHTLDAVAEQLERGDVEVRDALLAQQVLIDMQRHAARARHALCRSSVLLALESGVVLDGGAR